MAFDAKCPPTPKGGGNWDKMNGLFFTIIKVICYIKEQFFNYFQTASPWGLGGKCQQKHSTLLHIPLRNL